MSPYSGSPPGHPSRPAAGGAEWDLDTERKPVIMVIDDSPNIRTVVEASFRRFGLQVFPYVDGLAAMQAITRGEVNIPDVLILDIGLPRMNGYEVARIFHEHPQCQNMALVMLTGRDGMVDRMRSRLVGARTYVKKPFRPTDLVREVFRILGYNVPGFTDAPISG